MCLQSGRTQGVCRRDKFAKSLGPGGTEHMLAPRCSTIVPIERRRRGVESKGFFSLLASTRPGQIGNSCVAGWWAPIGASTSAQATHFPLGISPTGALFPLVQHRSALTRSLSLRGGARHEPGRAGNARMGQISAPVECTRHKRKPRMLFFYHFLVSSVLHKILFVPYSKWR